MFTRSSNNLSRLKHLRDIVKLLRDFLFFSKTLMCRIIITRSRDINTRSREI